MSRGTRGRYGLILAAFLLVGCKTGTFPDPNDPNSDVLPQPDVLRRQIKGASDALLARVGSGEITDAQYRDMLRDYARSLLKKTDIESVAPAKAWEYADAFRTAQMWKEDEALLRIAVKAAKDSDRGVNDRLRLAEALAHLDRVEEAIDVARETFDAPRESKVPILYAVYLEIAPAAKGKGHDVELARLLEDASRQADLAVVDPNSDSGKAFLFALPHHQRNARKLAAELYLAAGRSQDAERVMADRLPTIKL